MSCISLRAGVFWDMASRALIARYVFGGKRFFHFLITNTCWKFSLTDGNECTSPHTIALDAPTFLCIRVTSSWFTYVFLEEVIYGGTPDHRSQSHTHKIRCKYTVQIPQIYSLQAIRGCGHLILWLHRFNFKMNSLPRI